MTFILSKPVAIDINKTDKKQIIVITEEIVIIFLYVFERDSLLTLLPLPI
jgi:hypothetical protein